MSDPLSPRRAFATARAALSRHFGSAFAGPTLSALLVIALAVDLLTLSRGSFQFPMTLAQTALFLLALFRSARREPAAPGLLDRADKAHAGRRLFYVSAVVVLALLALAQKWWVTMRSDLALRLSYESSYRTMGATITLAGILLLLGSNRTFSRFFAAFAEQPARQSALSFMGLAVFGAVLLSLPVCVREPTHVSFVNALFMATSAVCITGLSTYSLASEYTPIGQGVLLLLVQVGGLGIMVLSASLVVLTGRKLRARSSAVLAEVIDTRSVASLRGNIRGIVLFALTIEALGALLLYPVLSRHPEIALDHHYDSPIAGSGSVAWAAIFHAVSAFCNAGFTLTRDGLIPFADSYDVCAIISMLILLGGVGFPVLSELSTRFLERLRGRRPERLSLHTRTVLMLNVALLVVAAVLLAAFEWSASLSAQPWYHRPLLATFQSVVLRSSGFSTVDFATLTNAGLMLCMLFMFIGASPGGTGGGLKVTTFAVLFATLRTELRGDHEPYLFDRRIPTPIVRRALSVAFVSVLALTLVVLLLLTCESADPLHLAFEAVSAFATTGLSVNLTPSLSSAGKLVLVLTMLVGRIGPLTVAVAAAERVSRVHSLHPHERLLIG